MSNSWYINNFPIDLNLVDCRNCLEHKPPTLDAENCVMCTTMDAHMIVGKARECTSFTPYISDTSDVKEETPIEQEQLEPEDIQGLASFMALAKELDKQDQEEKKKSEVEEKIEVEWKPQSLLDKKMDFNNETMPAAMRVMFDVLKGMEKRLDTIEKKMPASNRWAMKEFFKKKKSKLVVLKNRYKWKVKGKIRRTKEKAKKKKTGLEALFSPKKEEKKEETKTT